MTITLQTKVGDLIDHEPYLQAELIAFNPGFAKLRNPVFRATMAKVASLETAAGFMGADLDGLLRHLRRGVLKDIIRELHLKLPAGAGAIPADVLDRLRTRFADLIANVDGAELAAMEQALIAEGMPVETVRSLCDLHVEVFTPALEQQTAVAIPAGHPLELFRRENQAIEELLDRLDELAARACVPAPGPAGQDSPGPAVPVCHSPDLLLDAGLFASLGRDFDRLADWLGKVDHHYQRKENQLFPVLEARGTTGPSQVMWAKDDEVRSQVKALVAAIRGRDADAFVRLLEPAVKAVRDMVFKEEHILFPLVMEQFGPADWERVQAGEAGLGYQLAPANQTASGAVAERPAPAAWASSGAAAERPAPAGTTPADGKLDFATGRLTLEQARLLFTHLPVDVSFVDANDEVAFYSENPDRIFPRTASVIGRKVQFCHPPKSVHIVQQILDEFRSGSRSQAEFWLNLGGRFIYIQYFAVRSDTGTYQGCLEVSQDLTRLRSLEGEKRLL